MSETEAILRLVAYIFGIPSAVFLLCVLGLAVLTIWSNLQRRWNMRNRERM